MLRKESQGIHWLEFELLGQFPEVQHAVILRHGGHSQGNYASLNMGKHMGDSPCSIQSNFSKVKEVFSISHLADSLQPHGNTVTEVNKTNYHQLPPGDGLFTSQANITLKITHADCQAAIFYDPIKKVLANVHCGWRGNVQNIYRETVSSMQNRFGSKSADIFVCISPSLGPEHSEFINYRIELPESFWQFQFKPYYFDLWAISEWQLKNAGILPDHMQFARICTFSNHEDCFSYRRNKPTGCHATICTLNDKP